MSGATAWAAVPTRRLPGDDRAGRRSWIRVGATSFVWSSGAGAAERVATGTGVPTAGAAGLALVTQVGRAFQDEHPDVRVLLDRGRHLVVDPAGIGAQARGDGQCWRVEPMPVDTVVVDRPALVAGRVDGDTTALLDQISTTALDADLHWLVGLGTRHSASGGFAAAVAGAAARLAGLGYAVTTPAITVEGVVSSNVVADRPGSGAGDLVLVTAHLDSINLAGGPAAPAPGADDNGSGSAGLLELARVLATRSWRHDLRLILFGGEEEGLHGSTQYVAALPPAERARITAVLNMDMVGTRNTTAPAVLLEGAPVSRGFMDDLAAAAATYSGLRVETSLSPFASDHVPFIDAGMPAVLTIEGADSANSNIHSDRDTLAHVDLDLMREILRMNLAALAGRLTAGASGPAAPRPGGPVVARTSGRLDAFVTGVDGAMHHKAWNGSTWQPFRSLGAP